MFLAQVLRVCVVAARLSVRWTATAARSISVPLVTGSSVTVSLAGRKADGAVQIRFPSRLSTTVDGSRADGSSRADPSSPLLPPSPMTPTQQFCAGVFFISKFRRKS